MACWIALRAGRLRHRPPRGAARSSTSSPARSASCAWSARSSAAASPSCSPAAWSRSSPSASPATSPGPPACPMWRFIWTTAVGYLPITAYFIYLGSQLEGFSTEDPILWIGAVAPALGPLRDPPPALGDDDGPSEPTEPRRGRPRPQAGSGGSGSSAASRSASSRSSGSRSAQQALAGGGELPQRFLRGVVEREAPRQLGLEAVVVGPRAHLGRVHHRPAGLDG